MSNAGPTSPGLVRVTVAYFGLIRDAVGLALEPVTLPVGSTVAQLLTLLAARHGPRFRDQVLGPDHGPLPNALLQLGGCNILHQQGLETVLWGEGEVELRIVVTPPFVGGG